MKPAALFTMAAVANVSGAHPPSFSWMNKALSNNERALLLVEEMTTEEKIGQMMQVEKGSVGDGGGVISDKFLGSILSGGGSVPSTGNAPDDWINMYTGFQLQVLYFKP